MDHSFDIIIVGGGMAGLTLAREIIGNGITEDRTLAVLEQREKYERDKIWSLWNVDNRDYSAYKLKSWNRFTIRTEREEIEIDTEFEYLSIDSATFYEEHLRIIKEDLNSSLFLNITITSLNKNKNGVNLLTSDDISFEAKQVFDSSLNLPLVSGPFDLLQHFKGIHIKTVEPVFDDQSVTLMDFTTDQTTGLNFIYTLPFSPTEALIEATWFSPEIVADEVYDTHIRTYLRAQEINNYSIEYEEKGVIPMSLSIDQQRNWDKVIKIGTAGGVTRPSTGYTFLLAHWHAKLLAKELASDTSSLPIMRSSWINFLDEVLLRILTKHPQLGPNIFLKLFERNHHQRIIRFLSGNSTMRDELSIMLRVPHRWVFIKEGMFALFKRLMFWKS